MLFNSVITQKNVNIFVNTKSIAIKCPKISLITNFSKQKINTIDPLYNKLLEIVCESLRERILFPFFTLRHIPKHVSKIIAVIPIKTSGLIGDKTENKDSSKIDILVFINCYKL